LENKKNNVKKKQNDAKKEIPKGVKKKGIFLNKKQNIAVVVISIITVASIVGGIALYMNMPKGGDLIVGVSDRLKEIDPHNAADTISIQVIDQVAEGLFDIDINDPNNKIIYNLATDHSWSADALELTCTLRQGVKFHDGTDFNAQTVKWTFDRLYGMIDRIFTAPYWQFPDGRWIINETQVIDEYTVKFVLNEPYVPLLGLLTSWSAYILSPSSTPKDEIIDVFTGDLVGTGPFIYNSYEPEVEVRMSPNPIYWGGKPAIDELIFSIISDAEALVDALFSGNISIVTSLGFSTIDVLDRLETNPSVILSEGPPTTTIQYLGMNNKRIPVEMRKAMGYAFDYDYFIEDILQGGADRMRSPIPKGILYSNTEDFDVPVLDLEIARKSLQDANWPGTAGLPLDEDEPWETLVDNDTPIATYNYTYNYGSLIREPLLPLLRDNYKKIGVKIVGAGMSFYEYVFRMYELSAFHRDMLELFQMGWIADYNEPSNFNPLMTNEEFLYSENFAQINDAQLQIWLEQSVRETDPIARELLYYNIQERFIEEIYPWVMLYVPKLLSFHRANLRGYIPNPIKIVFKTAYFV
jgi:peptide/nickel transport system substrate-binding protein